MLDTRSFIDQNNKVQKKKKKDSNCQIRVGS